MMRLLELLPDGNIRLTDRIPDHEIPRYAILSHVWGQPSQEVSYEDMVGCSARGKAGYNKLRFCGEQAAKDDLQYFWVDTCCIKKSDDAELSESIRSMFRWYYRAHRCYAYLSDVSATKKRKRRAVSPQRSLDQSFRSSRWFTRGWTLQELLAPYSVEFFSTEGERLGDKRSLERQIHEITGIPVSALRAETKMADFSTDQKFSWVAKRQTTREEDLTYCLFGIFGVSMPVLYGEGKEKADRRLRKEIDGSIVEKDDVRRIQILDWISASNYPAQQSDIIQRRQQGTGQWFLDAPEVAQWLSEARSTLFCPGIPGAGKTMVAAIAVNHLLNSAHAGSYGVAYIYCNHKAQADQDVSSMLAAILKQLVQGQPSAVDPLERLHQQHAYQGTRPALDEVYRVLKEVCAHCSLIYIVIDALDECRHDCRRQFFDKVRELQVRHDMRLMTTSRFIPDIVDLFKDASNLEVRAIEGDVRRYVDGQIHRLPSCVQRNAVLQQTIRERIAEAVDGM